MKRLLPALVLPLALVGCAKPPCKTTDAYWTNCLGEKKDQQGKYSGEWRDNMRHGHGAYEWSLGARYVGDWKANKRSGFGVNTWPIMTYVGEWNDDQPNGKGTMTHRDGRVESGRWKDGEFLGP